MNIIKSDEIDFYIGVNEIDTEIYGESGWRGFAEFMFKTATDAGTSIVVLTDAEGGFVGIATREMAEYIAKVLNRHSDSPEPCANCGHPAIDHNRFRDLDNRCTCNKCDCVAWLGGNNHS